MRLYFLKSKRHAVLFYLSIFMLVTILLLSVFLFLCLWRSERIPDSFSQSKTPWVCHESDFSFVIYNKNNLTDEGKSYVDWLEKKGISFGVWDGVGVLSHKEKIAYYHIAIDGTSNFFETPVAVLNYSVSKPSMDSTSQEEVYYVCSFYSMTMSMNKTTLTLNLNSTVEDFDDIAFDLFGERVCFSNQSGTQENGSIV